MTKPIRTIAVAATLAATIAVRSATVAADIDVPAPKATCKNGQIADNVHWISGAGFCLAAKTYGDQTAASANPIVVVIHADNGGRMGNKFEKIAEKIASDFHVIAVALLRPGYRRGGNNADMISEGTAHKNDDDYSRENVDIIAGTLMSLRGQYPGRKVLLVGSSGGSALSALVLGIHPHTADGAVLAGCPCDIPNWRSWRNASVGNDLFWSRSLSPDHYIEGIPPDTVLVAVNGSEDSNTLPKFADAYIKAAVAHGVSGARFFTVPGATHTSVTSAPAFYQAIGEAIDGLAAR
ncbi:MAG: alpha/beta fold hydrolase [Gemmatimonas sp.]